MDSEHIVKAYDQELQHLDNIIAEMGGLAESQLAQAMAALVKRDGALAERVRAEDRRIDLLERDVDALAVKVLALRQPMAADLRIVITALKISSNLERIGDYAKNVAKRTMTLVEAPVPAPPMEAAHTIARMATLAQGMIKDVLDAYVARDADMAVDVRQRDQEVDRLYSSLFRELLTYMMEDPGTITPCTHLLFIAKNVERIGDHVTNIAEQVYFMVRGEVTEIDRPKGDRSSFTVVEPAPPADGGETEGDGGP